MEQTVLGATGLLVSPLGLGTVELGMPYGIGKSAPPDDAACLRLLHRARDLGVRYFDTAPVYGRSEELLGRAFGGHASSHCVVATKVLLRDPEGRTLSGAALVTHVEESARRSLQRLGRDRLDVLQIHSVEEGAFVSHELLEVAARLSRVGVVGHWGVSTYGRRAPLATLEQAQRFRVLQVAYSVLDRTLEDEVIPRCRRQGIGLVVRSVFLQGVLSDRRHQLSDHLAPLRAAAGQVAAIAADLGRPLPEVALRFAHFESGAHVTLVGTADPAELEANLAAFEAGPLPSDAVAALRQTRVADERLLSPASWSAPVGPRATPTPESSGGM